MQIATMPMSCYLTSPKKGHLERLKRIYGYLRQIKSAATRVRIEEPDFPPLPVQEVDWPDTVYGNVKEEIAKESEPLGKPVLLVSNVDDNL
jgi:hypothetical protein